MICVLQAWTKRAPVSGEEDSIPAMISPCCVFDECSRAGWRLLDMLRPTVIHAKAYLVWKMPRVDQSNVYDDKSLNQLIKIEGE